MPIYGMVYLVQKMQYRLRCDICFGFDGSTSERNVCRLAKYVVVFEDGVRQIVAANFQNQIKVLPLQSLKRLFVHVEMEVV